jgi:PAS domain S-box-containing protein
VIRDLRTQLRVLVIDDDEVDRERVRRFLAKAGFDATVIEEPDPTTALPLLRKSPPDVIVLDYEFPRHDGLTVLRHIREMDALTPVIVLTGHDETTLAVELMKAGAADYIPKGNLTPERLAQSVRQVLRLRRSDMAARAAQEALRMSEELNRSILESTHDCIKVLTLEGNLVSMSPKGQQALGIKDFSKVQGTSWLSMWDGPYRHLADAAFAEGRAGRAGKFIGASVSPAGREIWWDVVVTPMLGATRAPERLLVISREVAPLGGDR